MSAEKESSSELKYDELSFPEGPSHSGIQLARLADYAYLDELGEVYLDYTGGSVYSLSQLHRHQEILAGGVFGNPHSLNPTSHKSTLLIEQAREDILRYFGASLDDYTVIFTANASGALRLIAESYPFHERGQLLLSQDNHNSVNGMRQFAQRVGAPHHYARTVAPELRLHESVLMQQLDEAFVGGNNLFVYPAQSNFSGVKHPLTYVEKAQQRGWDVVLDCAAFVPTNRLDLATTRPDFVSLSFYKMFGYPTGIGALIAKKDKLQKLKRPWFAGGTVDIASALGNFHSLIEGAPAYEDGTVNYLNIPAISIGLQQMQRIGIDNIDLRTQRLTAYLLEELSQRKHKNGQALCRVLGPTSVEMRGGTVALHLFDPDGVPYRLCDLERRAAAHQISLRTGCFCNPGAYEAAVGLAPNELRRVHQQGVFSLHELTDALGQAQLGAVRVSFGIASNYADVSHFLRFLDQECLQVSSGEFASRAAN